MSQDGSGDEAEQELHAMADNRNAENARLEVDRNAALESGQNARPPVFRTASTYDGSFASNCVVLSARELRTLVSSVDSDESSDSEDDNQIDKHCVLWACLINMTTPSCNSDGKEMWFSHGNKKNAFGKKLKTAITTYKRIYYFCDLHDPFASIFAIIEQNQADHNKFWMRDPSKKNVSIGSKFAILSPKAQGILKNGATLIYTDRPFEMLDKPAMPIKLYQPHKVKKEMTYFCLKGVSIKRQKHDTPVAINTLCSAEACDRLKFGNNVNATCPCFAQFTRNGSTAKNCCIKMDFRFKVDSEWVDIEGYTSLRTSRLLFEGEVISFDCSTLTNNTIAARVSLCWRKLIRYVNTNGGWTIIGWFVRAVKSDDDKQENDEDAIHETIKTNIAYLYPSTLKHSSIPVNNLVTNDFIRQALVSGQDNSRDASADNI